MNTRRTSLNLLIFILIIVLFSTGCTFYSNFTAYYNTYYNAKNRYKSGLEEKLKGGEENTSRIKKVKGSKDFRDAIEKCWKIIEFHGYENKYSDDAVLLIIKSEYQLEKITQAKEHIKAFYHKFPKSDLTGEVLLWEGKCLLFEKDTTAAEELLNKALVRAADSRVRADVYLEFAELNFAAKRYEEAVKLYEKALKEAETKIQKANIQFYLAESYFNNGNYKKAADTYKKVLKFTPTIQIEFNTQFHYAASLAKLDKFDNALMTLEKMLTAQRFKEYHSKIYSLMGDIFKENNDFTSAKFYYNKGIKLKKGEGSALCAYSMGELYELTFAKVDSAIYFYNMVPKLSRNSEIGKIAEKKISFLGKLNTIKKKVDYEKKYVYRYENDFFFRDSLRDVRKADSIYQINKSKKIVPLKELLDRLVKGDTSRVFYTKKTIELSEEYKFDSLRVTKKLDSLTTDFQRDSLVYLDTTRYKKTDKIASVFFEYVEKTKSLQKAKKHGVEKRSISRIKSDLKKHILELGDFYLLETAMYDSAKVIFEKFVKQYKDSVYTPKALYALAYIAKNYEKNEEKSNDYLASLTGNYPNSVFAKRAEKKPQNKSVSTIKNTYLKAENFLFSGKVDSALYLFKSILTYDSLSGSPWVPKTLFAIAYIYEHQSPNIDSALYYYKQVAERFPDTDYGKKGAVKSGSGKQIAQNVDKKRDKPKNKGKDADTFNCDEEAKNRISERINELLQSEYEEQVSVGEMRRFWSKKQLREFLNNL